ncbi:MAG: RteC domain-containing protein [Bacteroidales bacterium]|nr:RteC domain-containing protein [Bacteroidales bacterium]
MNKAIQLLDMQIAFVEKQMLSQHNSLPAFLQWQGGVMEFVELVYALHEAGCFGKVPLKNVFACVGKVFGCEISNYYRLFWDVRNRIGEERTFFLKKLITALSEKLNRMDRGAKS